VYALALDPVDNTLLVGGDFSAAGSVTSGPVARYNPTSNAWSVVVPGYRRSIDDKVYALVADSDGIYVGGDFYDVNVSSAREVNSLFYFQRSDKKVLAFPNGNTYGVTYKDAWGKVYALALAPDNGELYVGGRFDSVGGIAASGLAVDNDSGWHAIGNVGEANIPEVRTLTFAGDDANTVYIGGRFRVAGTTTGKHIAKYNRGADTWSELGSGLLIDDFDFGGPNGALALAPANGKLYVAGQFLRAGDHPAASFGIYTDPDAVVPNITPNPQATATVTTTPDPKITPTVTTTPNPNMKPRAYLPLVRK
jgi:trimeric autotransporter adhesin